jgi:hypothetical protein
MPERSVDLACDPAASDGREPPQPRSTPRSRIDVDLAGLTLLLLLAQAWRLPRAILPLHDTLEAFQIFHYFHSSLYFQNRLPEWVPYSGFGVPSDIWSLVALTPASWLALGVGWLARVQDSLLLFKLSLLVEQLAFLLGMHLLSRLLFRTRLAALFVCAGAVLSVNWSTQIWLDFRIYSLFPLGLYFLMRFFGQGLGVHLWLAGAVFTVSLLGSIPYFGPLYLFLVSVVAAVFAGRRQLPWRALLVRSRSHLAGLALFALAACGYLAFVQGATRSLDVVTFGRDSASGETPLYAFLYYGGHPALGDLLRMGIVGWPMQGTWSGGPDQTLYIGLLPIFLAGWAAARVRSTAFLAILAATAALLWLSIGGVFARLVYAFPAMTFFRHLGQLYSLAKLLLLLCAGFGLDEYQRSGRRWHLLLGVLLLLLAADGLVGYFEFARLLGGPGEPPPLWLVLFAARVVGYATVGLAIATLAPDRLRTTGASWVLFAVFLFDLASFQVQARHYQPLPPPSLAPALSAVQVAGFPYQDARARAPGDDRGQGGARLMSWAADQDSALYDVTAAFLRFDPCPDVYPAMLMTKAVDALIGASAIPIPPAADRQRISTLVGCETSKLRLTERLPGGEPSADPPTPAAGTARVEAFAPDEIAIRVEVSGSAPAWLVYADADHPDWRASVNGAAAPIEAAYGAFKAVQVPPGPSSVRFEFRPGILRLRSWVLGASAAALAALLLAGYLATLLGWTPRHGFSRSA